MIYIGIDPGQSGGIAIIGGVPPSAQKMPATPRDLLDVLEAYRGAEVKAILERVNAGVFGAQKIGGRMGVVSAFTFGRGVGYLEMALTAACIPFELVSPVVWQKALGCRTGGDKNISKRRAQQLFPTLRITHATADALLLAEYGRRLEARA